MKRLLDWLPAIVALGVLLAALLLTTGDRPDPAPPPSRPTPTPAPAPEPCPDDRCPKPRPKPWGEPFQATVGGPRNADGTELDCDLPERFHVKNRGGSDGSGLCVFASMRHSGLWADEPVFSGLFEFMFTRPGGGHPQKVDRMVDAYCKAKNVPKPDYIQVEGSDLEILRAACKAGLMPGVTYYRSPTGRYGGRRISHMVSLVAAGEKWFAILDNNYPRSYEWMAADEFRQVYTGGRSGWAIVPLKPGPPPVPRRPSTQGVNNPCKP
jgi:hypothetical protein